MCSKISHAVFVKPEVFCLIVSTGKLLSDLESRAEAFKFWDGIKLKVYVMNSHICVYMYSIYLGTHGIKLDSCMGVCIRLESAISLPV